jgi:hypothetical protein
MLIINNVKGQMTPCVVNQDFCYDFWVYKPCNDRYFWYIYLLDHIALRKRFIKIILFKFQFNNEFIKFQYLAISHLKKLHESETQNILAIYSKYPISKFNTIRTGMSSMGRYARDISICRYKILESWKYALKTR